MKRAFHLSLGQTVALLAAGILIAAVGFLIAIPFHARVAACRWTFRTLLILPLVIVGMVIAVRATSNIENGIAADRWPEKDLNVLRNYFESAFGIAIPWVMIVAMGAAWIAAPKYRGIGWAIFIALHALSRLRYVVVRQNSTSVPRLTDDWRNRPPLQSQHWGQ